MAFFEVRDLAVEVAGRRVVDGVSLLIGEGEVHVLMGPNASGKSSLLKAIMGDPRYVVKRGYIVFNNITLNGLKPYERAKLGIALAYQHPPAIGVKVHYLLQKVCEKYGYTSRKYKDILSELGVEHLVERELFKGFSGGEAKRLELALTLLQKPKLALLDEPDSGVDVDSLKVVGKAISRLVEEGSAVLIVTHTGQILSHVPRVDALHVMIAGKLAYSGDPAILKDVLTKGYAIFERGGLDVF